MVHLWLQHAKLPKFWAEIDRFQSSTTSRNMFFGLGMLFLPRNQQRIVQDGQHRIVEQGGNMAKKRANSGIF